VASLKRRGSSGEIRQWHEMKNEENKWHQKAYQASEINNQA